MKKNIYFNYLPISESSMKLIDRLKRREKNRRILVVDGKYLASLPKNWSKKLEEDLTKVFKGGEVYLIPPKPSNYGKKMPDYGSVRSHIAYWSLIGNYTITTTHDYDAKMILAAGGRLSKKSKKPYKLDSKPAYS